MTSTGSLEQAATTKVAVTTAAKAYSCTRPGDEDENILEYVIIGFIPKDTVLYLPSEHHLPQSDPLPFTTDPDLYPEDTFSPEAYITKEDLPIAIGAPPERNLAGICYNVPDECYIERENIVMGTIDLIERPHPQGWREGPFIYLCYTDLLEKVADY